MEYSNPNIAVELGQALLRPHEFFVIRYVPDVVRGEFLNIGIVVREIQADGNNGPRRAAVRITRDWNRVTRLHLNADLRLIQDMENEFENWLRNVMISIDDPLSDFDRRLKQLSLTIQLTDAQACLATDVNTHLEVLMRIYVDAGYTTQPIGGLNAIQHTVREWVHESNINDTYSAHLPSEKYTGKGDPLTFDCFWVSEQAVHIIQAVFIEDSLDEALALAQRMAGLTDGVLTLEGKRLEMTVVTNLPPEPSSASLATRDLYTLAVSAMREAGIRVVTVADLPTLAREVRRATRP